jgi:pantothenate kinase
MHDLIARALAAIRERHDPARRCLVAVAGPPAAGKSTFAADLVSALNARGPVEAVVVPMDGFHLDNVQLARLGLMQRKGAANTFDVDGFRSLLERIRATHERPVYFPVFDRAADQAVAGAGVVLPSTGIVVVEGNYLLLDEHPWNGLASLFDVEIYLDVPLDCLERRLIRRWLDHGHDQEAAARRAHSNDIPNARHVASRLRSGPGLIRLAQGQPA